MNYFKVGLWLALVAAVVGGLWMFGANRYAAGQQEVRSEWNAAVAIQLKAQLEDQLTQQKRANEISAAYQAERAKLVSRLKATEGALNEALNSPVKGCPSTAGDIVLPGNIGLLLNSLSSSKPAAKPTD